VHMHRAQRRAGGLGAAPQPVQQHGRVDTAAVAHQQWRIQRNEGREGSHGGKYRVARQGCALHPLRSRATATATAEAGFLRGGGVGPVAGDAVNPQAGPAAGGCAFGRLRSSASQAKRPHPWGLDGAIHGANGPAHPHRPASDRFRALLVGVDLGRHICQISNEIRGQIRFPAENGSDPKMFPTDRGQLSKAGWVRWQGRERHGWRDRASMDGFTASPATPPRHPSGSPLLLLLWLLPLLWLEAGAGRSPARNTPLVHNGADPARTPS